MISRWTTRPGLRIAGWVGIAVVVLAALYAAVGFLLVPWLAQRYALPALEQKLGRDVRAGELRFNPFLLTLEARELSVGGLHGLPLLSAGRVFADASAWGLLRGAWALDEVQIEALQGHIVMQPDGTLNVAEVAQRWREDKSTDSSGGTRPVVIRHLSVAGARIQYTDLRPPEAASVQVEAIDLQADNVSTRPDERTTYEMTATLPAGGSLHWRGEAGLAPSVTASGQVQVQGFSVHALWPILRKDLRLSDLQATADFSATYLHGPDQPLALADVRLDASRVLATAQDGARLLQVQRVAVRSGAVDLAQHGVRLGEVLLAKGESRIVVAQDGSLNWAVAGGSGKQAEAASGGQAAAAWSVEVPQLRLESMDVRYASHASGRAVALDATGFSGEAGISLSTEASTRLVVGKLQAGWQEATLQLPETSVPRLAIGSARVQTARLEVETGGPATQVKASGIDATVHDVVLAGTGDAQAALRFGAVSVSAGTFDLASRTVGADTVSLQGAATLVRGPQGQVELPGLGTAVAPATSAGQGGGEPWRYAIDALKVPSFDVTWVDRTFEPAMRVRATVQASAEPLASGQEAAIQATASIASGGSIRATGTMAAEATSVRARITADGIALRPFQPVLAQLATLEIRSGSLSAAAQVTYDRARGGLRAEGTAGIADLAVHEAASGDRFLSWKQLDARGASIDLASRRIAIEDIVVAQPGAKIVISQDRKLNLAQVLRNRSGSDAQPGSQGFDFDVGRLRLRAGEVDFADLSLVLPFSTAIHAFEGTVAGISSRPSQRADVQAQGRIGEYGSASVRGTLVPVEPSRYTDLNVEFSNVLLPPLSPYTATFAGRKVSAGRLWLDLEYRIDNGELLGSNDIRLADFKLGERVEAPNAMDVPLELAVALLSDPNGEIHLSVPVTGELGNPKFSVASAVRQAVGNVLRRIVSAPFRALAGVFGGGDRADTLAAVEFLPGSAGLRPEQREKLDALSLALRERPQLQLHIAAPYDPRADVQALQREQARRALAVALGADADAQREPGPIAYDDPATRRAIQNMLQSLAGHDAVAQLMSSFPVGGDPRELYRAMFERVVASQPATGVSPQVLGVERARTIADYLRQQGVDAARLRMGELETVGAGRDGDVASQLQIAAVSPAAGG